MERKDPLTINIWDVGHGLSITLSMPNGDLHWIDLGSTDDFSPSRHMYGLGHREVKNLIITHPDQDHLSDLPAFFESFGLPTNLTKNQTIPDAVAIGSGEFEYQKVLRKMYNRRRIPCAWDQDPRNPKNNGGVEFFQESNDYDGDSITGNNASIVSFIYYEDFLLVCPGDLEPEGWEVFYSSNERDILDSLIDTELRVLIAPHHGRMSGYSEHMMDMIRPHAVIISDVWGDSETHPDYYTRPVGINFGEGNTKKYYSTKRGGRVKIEITPESRRFHQE